MRNSTLTLHYELRDLTLFFSSLGRLLWGASAAAGRLRTSSLRRTASAGILSSTTSACLRVRSLDAEANTLVGDVNERRSNRQQQPQNNDSGASTGCLACLAACCFCCVLDGEFAEMISRRTTTTEPSLCRHLRLFVLRG